jgi:hypothetical protein
MATCAHYVKERVLEVGALSGSMTFETADGAVTFEYSVEEGHALTQDDGERLVLGHRAWGAPPETADWQDDLLDGG